MNNTIWILADLSDEQLGLIKKAEQTLGTDYLLVYRPMNLDSANLKPADLDESQLECLRGLEATLNAVIVAYRPADEFHPERSTARTSVPST